jgi:hypothetical protein
MHWRIKGLVQGVLSLLPAGAHINDLLQRTIGGLSDFQANVEMKVSADWKVLMSHMTELGVSPKGLTYVEVGTGWYPTLPFCYSLAGAESCTTIDLVRHMNSDLTLRMVRALGKKLPTIAEASGRIFEEVCADYSRLARCRAIPELLRSARIEYCAPADAAHTGLPNRSVDVVYSNSVLEHLPVSTLRAIMRESRRILKSSGLSIHSVNCGDHYAYFDRKITEINYLRYSSKRWKVWNNSLLFQNRLRPKDFLEIAEEAGFRIMLAKFKPRPELLQAISEMKVSPEFSRYPLDQLACTSVDFVCRPKHAAV